MGKTQRNCPETIGDCRKDPALEQIDQYNRPAPKDKLESGVADSDKFVDETLDEGLTKQEELDNDSATPSATYGSITNMEAQNQDTWQDRPETDPFQENE